jgi:hypothetical protein
MLTFHLENLNNSLQESSSDSDENHFEIRLDPTNRNRDKNSPLGNCKNWKSSNQTIKFNLDFCRNNHRTIFISDPSDKNER